MPSLGADMVSGTLIEWQIKPGDVVKRGDVVAIVETDKGNIDVEVWHDGIVDRLVVAPGTTVPVGTVLAELRPSDAAPPAATPAPAPPPVALPTIPPATPSAPHLRASPGARQLARELGIDLAGIHGTGPEGAITRQDVATAPRAHAPTPPAPAPQPPAAALPSPGRPDGMRRVIAAAMSRSKREIPHYYVANEVDFTRCARWLEGENQRRAVADRLLPVVLPLKAIALALREFPELNGYFTDGEFRPADGIHVGFAISLRKGGLVVPALHDVGRQPVSDLMRAVTDLIQRARTGGLRSSELSDATITVTSLGERGTDSVFGIIYPPQVALIGLGRLRERPWAEDGLIGARPVLTTTLAADHRVSDGHRGARFLSRLAELLKDPEKL